MTGLRETSIDPAPLEAPPPGGEAQVILGPDPNRPPMTPLSLDAGSDEIRRRVYAHLLLHPRTENELLFLDAWEGAPREQVHGAIMHLRSDGLIEKAGGDGTYRAVMPRGARRVLRDDTTPRLLVGVLLAARTQTDNPDEDDLRYYERYALVPDSEHVTTNEHPDPRWTIPQRLVGSGGVMPAVDALTGEVANFYGHHEAGRDFLVGCYEQPSPFTDEAGDVLLVFQVATRQFPRLDQHPKGPAHLYTGYEIEQMHDRGMLTIMAARVLIDAGVARQQPVIRGFRTVRP